MEVFVSVICCVGGSTGFVGDCGRVGLRDTLSVRIVEEGEPEDGCVCEDESELLIDIFERL